MSPFCLLFIWMGSIVHLMGMDWSWRWFTCGKEWFNPILLYFYEGKRVTGVLARKSSTYFVYPSSRSALEMYSKGILGCGRWTSKWKGHRNGNWRSAVLKSWTLWVYFIGANRGHFVRLKYKEVLDIRGK